MEEDAGSDGESGSDGEGRVEETGIERAVGAVGLSEEGEASGDGGASSASTDDEDGEEGAGQGDAPRRRSNKEGGRTGSVHERVARQHQASKARAKTSSAFRGRNTNKSRNAGKRKGDKMKASVDY